MPPTVAVLIRDRMGPLVCHHDFAVAAEEEPLAWAREKVRELMKDRTEQTQIDDAVLVATELLSNAFRHEGGPVSLTFDVYERGVTVGVGDRGKDISTVPTDPVSLLAGMPDEEVTELDEDDLPESGQGLLLITACSTAWEVQRTGQGKVVTAAICRTGSSE
ncbi:ATP-binding region ATPase domain protein (plasmid) [Streptomyces alboflavus]|uniref:ATP-binding region ATPase domain protein n=1 Tax=Streptomyces alboflavus TaxID=67267 RepID=A0A291W4Y4_9ACTN|nr:ATP-binding protein [Streptomyces alboflavus]ATM24639.1 ATP-binding region ATPase domain protein [Streptomyces alboflavus]